MRRIKKIQDMKWTPFEEIQDRPVPLPDGCTKVVKNSRWMVFYYRPALTWMGMAQLIMIRSAAATWEPPKGHSWGDFQRIKNELFGEDAQAVELYPRARDLVDQANLYWLWILHEPKPDAWEQHKESQHALDYFDGLLKGDYKKGGDR